MWSFKTFVLKSFFDEMNLKNSETPWSYHDFTFCLHKWNYFSVGTIYRKQCWEPEQTNIQDLSLFHAKLWVCTYHDRAIFLMRLVWKILRHLDHIMTPLFVMHHEVVFGVFYTLAKYTNVKFFEIWIFVHKYLSGCIYYKTVLFIEQNVIHAI